MTAEFAPYQSWVFDTYLFDETVASTTDRRAIGFQTRYSELGRSAVGLIDYDVYFKQLNSATLIGNLKIGQSWILGFDADHRRSPLLLLTNALIGQSAPDIPTLETEFTPSQIKQLALDHRHQRHAHSVGQPPARGALADPAGRRGAAPRRYAGFRRRGGNSIDRP